MKNEKFVFGIDLDFVLANWEGEGSMFKDIWERRFPFCHYRGVKNSLHWSIAENYPSEMRSQIVEIYKNPVPGFYESMPLMNGAKDALKTLKGFGNIVIVSTPVQELLFDLNNQKDKNKFFSVTHRVEKEKVNWIEENICPILGEMPSIRFLQDKSLFRGHILVDDNPAIATGCKTKPKWEHVLYNDDYLYNRDSKIENQICWTKEGWLETILNTAKENTTFKPTILA